MNIALVGFMGTGKSAVGKRLAAKLDWDFIDIDQVIEKSASLSIPQIFEQLGEEEFRNLERISIYGATRGKNKVIATGGGAFADEQNRRCLSENAFVVCLTSNPEIIFKRVQRRIANRPLLANSDDPLKTITDLLKRRQKDYARADKHIDASDMSIDEEVDAVYQAVEGYLRCGKKT